VIFNICPRDENAPGKANLDRMAELTEFDLGCMVSFDTDASSNRVQESDS
jgi:hypothetical protein